MHRRQALKLFAGLALCPLCASAGLTADGVHWSYEGHSGPDKWGELDQSNKACSIGAEQSPIDIDGAIRAELPPLQITWGKNARAIVNNGHTIQVNYDAGSTLTVGNNAYTLLQYHFHRPSEHLIDGKNFAMEVHFVHRDGAGNLAVVGVMMTPGKANPAFASVIAGMPSKAGQEAALSSAIDANQMLPAGRGYYRYAGSLTTPPCSETVAWNVLREPVEVAPADIDAFAKLYPMNARPAQKGNRRFVLVSG